MAFVPGAQLGPYRIVSRLGKGGMGEVWLANDTRLRRDVAVKTIFESLQANPEMTARFEREARLLGSLNHPGIAAVYGYEQFDSRFCLIFEYVPGETLSELIARGRLDATEAVGLAIQLANALESAHGRGVIHRDLKPSNIKITPDGQLKTLDFGLAKGVEESGAHDDGVSTLTLSATQHGKILGTPAYMSPEQARGKPVDCQTDIWSFGCIVFEMLSGRRAMEGDTVSDVLASVLQRDPPWELLPASTPRALKDLISRCVTREKRERFHCMADIRIELDHLVKNSAKGEAPLGIRREAKWQLVAGIALSAVIAAAATRLVMQRAVLPAPAVAAVLSPGGLQPGEFDSPAAISNDGSRMVFVVRSPAGRSLVGHRTERLDYPQIPGTEGASEPFFSPDGGQIAFFAGGKLRKVPFEGGPVIDICDAPSPHGGTWGPDDTIVLAPSSESPLVSVSVSGGAPKPLTIADKAQVEIQRLPFFLPTRRMVLFTVARRGQFFDSATIEAISLDGKRTRILSGGYDAQYANGHLVYARGGGLYSVSFDPNSLRTRGEPALALDGVQQDAVEGSAQYNLSPAGTLIYLPSDRTQADGTIVFIDRHGNAHPLTDSRKAFFGPRVSPDGTRVAVTVADGDFRSIWICHLARRSVTRLTLRNGVDGFPVWSPDSAYIAYTSNQGGIRNLYRIPADGSGQPERLATSTSVQLPAEWSHDGRYILYDEGTSSTKWDIWAIPIGEAGKPGTPRVVVQTNFTDVMPALSADGKWLAWTSDESGRNEVYIRAFPPAGPKLQVSTGGGSQPVWSRKGMDLFFRQGDRFYSAKIAIAPRLEASPPQLLFAGDFDQGRPNTTNYDVNPSDEGFIAISSGDPKQSALQMNVLFNWAAGLSARLTSARR